MLQKGLPGHCNRLQSIENRRDWPCNPAAWPCNPAARPYNAPAMLLPGPPFLYPHPTHATHSYVNNNSRRTADGTDGQRTEDDHGTEGQRTDDDDDGIDNVMDGRTDKGRRWQRDRRDGQYIYIYMYSSNGSNMTWDQYSTVSVCRPRDDVCRHSNELPPENKV